MTIRLIFACLVFGLVLTAGVNALLAAESETGDSRSLGRGAASSASQFELSSDQIKQHEKRGLSGDGNAAFRLAQHFSMVALEPDKARYWMLIAAENGEPKAFYGLAFMMRHDTDSNSRLRAQYWLSRAIKEGPPEFGALARSLMDEIAPPK